MHTSAWSWDEALSDVSDVPESSSLSCSESLVTYDEIRGLIPLKWSKLVISSPPSWLLLLEALLWCAGNAAARAPVMVFCSSTRVPHALIPLMVLLFAHKLLDFRTSSSLTSSHQASRQLAIVHAKLWAFGSHQPSCTCAGHMHSTSAASPVLLRHVPLAAQREPVHNCPGSPQQGTRWRYAWHTM